MQKTKSFKKTMALLMTLAILLVMVPATALADDTLSSVTVDSLTVSVSSTYESLQITTNSAYDFNIGSTTSSFPYSFSLILTTGAYTGTPSVSSGTFSVYSSAGGYDYGLVTLTGASTIAIVTNSSHTLTFHCPAPNGGTGTGTSGVYAYLPAPGQYVNEGMGSGGWGDVYTSAGVLKNNTSTGVSLGSFGGYYVYKFASPILNSDTNPYGTDFIVYGNAFWNNSEPGCIQVSPNGTDWYSIAGSLYYTSSTTKGASVTYTNPTQSDDNTGTTSTLATVSYTGTVSGSVTTNTFHNHSWFPLNRNYFASRTIGGVTCPAMDLDSSLPFVTYTPGSGSTASTVTYTGDLLTGISPSNTASMLFGYCDVHPNKTLASTTAYNPYAVSSVTSSSAWNTFVGSTGGGDPIDISWAVNSDGTPHYLSNIQYVRIYTGVAQNNGASGEVSTEILGVAAATGTGSGAALKDLEVWNSAETAEYSTTNMSTTTLTAGSYVLYSEKSHVYVNGSPVTDAADGHSFTISSGNTIQIITQNGTESPYITVLKGA